MIKKLLLAVTLASLKISTAYCGSGSNAFLEELGVCYIGGVKYLGQNDIGLYGMPVTTNCQGGKLSIKCDSESFVPECVGKNGQYIEYDPDQLISRALDNRAEYVVDVIMENKRKSEGKAPYSENERQDLLSKARDFYNGRYPYDFQYSPISPAQTSSNKTSPTNSSTKLSDTQTNQNKPLESGPVTGATDSVADASKMVKDATTQIPDSLSVANQGKMLENTSLSNNSSAQTGSTVSGKVEESFVGATFLDNDYGMGSCASSNIFQHLACRAGVIGSGLKSVAYMIAGFGLIVFSFAAIFGKVKWPLFATIMFCCFLLSATVFVVNTMTKSDDASWIGGIKSNGNSYSADAAGVPATDSGDVPAGEAPK